MQDVKSRYAQAHLMVAVIRVLEYRHKAPPSIETVCEFIPCSLEHGYTIIRKLAADGIIKLVESAFTTKVIIADHLKIEDLPREETGSSLGSEIEKFQKSRQDMAKKVEIIQAELSKKKKDLFAELEKKLQKEKKE